LVVIDIVLLAITHLVASWVVFRSIPSLFDTIVNINIIGLIILLTVVKFYRIRISESSLDVMYRAFSAFAPAFALAVITLGSYLGYTSPWISFILVADGFGFTLLMGARVSYRSVLSYRNKHYNTNLPRAIIYGAGELGGTLIRQYQKGKLLYHIVGLADDDPKLKGALVLGIKV
jgi:FlaA1/EpsC-like NDP-sugar epimerase